MSTPAISRCRAPTARPLALALALGATGCIGVFTYADAFERVASPCLDAKHPSRVRSAPGTPPLTRDQLERAWGRPDEIDRDGPEGETWVYRTDGLRWHGAMPVVVLLPLPLVLPWGHREVGVRFDGERAVEAWRLSTDEDAALVGLIFWGPCFAFEWAHLDDWDHDRQVDELWVYDLETTPAPAPSAFPSD